MPPANRSGEWWRVSSDAVSPYHNRDSTKNERYDPDRVGSVLVRVRWPDFPRWRFSGLDLYVFLLHLPRELGSLLGRRGHIRRS